MDAERQATAAASRGLHAKVLRQAAQNYKAGDMSAFHETLTVATIQGRQASVTISKPQDPDCPLIGCSDSFLNLTGYSRAEVIGRNPRFLNKGCTISAEDRHRMRIAVCTGKNFRGVLQNRRRGGEVWICNLHMHALRIGNAMYILGIQADVTSSSMEAADKAAKEELQALVDDIFAANVDAWAMLQVMQHNGAKLGHVPYTESILLPRSDPAAYIKARDMFVSVEHDLLENHFMYKNTFLEVYDCNEDTFLLGLRHVSSEPALGLRQLEGQRPQDLTDASSGIRSSDPSANKPALPSLRQIGGGRGEGRVATLDSLGPMGQASSRVRDATALTIKVESTEEAHLQETGQPATLATQERDDEHDSKSSALYVSHQSAEDKDFDSMKPEFQAAPPQTSEGSSSHPESCRPCAFHCYSLVACNQGEDCLYCHMDHPRKRRQRGRQARKARRDVEGLNDEEATEMHKDDESGCEAERTPAVVEKVPEKAPPAQQEKASSPTPDGLVPLLTALEFLSPLPMPDMMTSAAKASQPKLAALMDDAASTDEQVSLEYSECSINLIVGQWKNILPFVGGDGDGPKRFRVFPALPRGLTIDNRNGVISGTARTTTSPDHSVHTVVMECRAGVAEAVLMVQVLD